MLRTTGRVEERLPHVEANNWAAECSDTPIVDVNSHIISKEKELLLVKGRHKRNTTPTEFIFLVGVHPLLFKKISVRRLRMHEASKERW
jgi:hypothetical protein